MTQAELKPDSFDDTADILSWLHQRRSELLDVLGRPNAAREAMKVAAETNERGNVNVSQILNRAGDLVFENPREALRLADIAAGRPASPYGRAVELRHRACALAALGERTKGVAALDALLKIERDGAAGLNFVEAALCLDAEDRAADVLIAHLGDDGQRLRAIAAMQVDLPQPYESPRPEDKVYEQKLRALVSRPDVQAALAPHGRILTLAPADLWSSSP